MTAETARLRELLNDALEVIAVADTAKTLGTTALTDVLATPEPIRTRLLDILRRCWILNAEILAAGQRLSVQLDGLASAETGVQSALTIKAAARALRPALKVLHDPHRFTACEYVAASRTVDDVAALLPRDRLLSGSMRHELRSRAFGTLTGHLFPRPDVVGGRVAIIGSSSHLVEAA